MRCYEVAWLDRTGRRSSRTLTAPIHPVLEDICGAIAHGSLVQTTCGPIAVEDLEPGMAVPVADGRSATLRWIGAFTSGARRRVSRERPALIRIIAGAFGTARPVHDLIVAPGARLLLRHPMLKARLKVAAAFAPAEALIDGETVIAVNPMSPVTLYNLSFGGQAGFLANGLEVEGFHPGIFTNREMDLDIRDAALRLVPQIEGPGEVAPAPLLRLTAQETRALHFY